MTDLAVDRHYRVMTGAPGSETKRIWLEFGFPRGSNASLKSVCLALSSSVGIFSGLCSAALPGLGIQHHWGKLSPSDAGDDGQGAAVV